MVAVAQRPDAQSPLALVVFDDEAVGRSITEALKGKGFRTFSIESILGDSASLDGLRPEVIVLDVRRNAFAAAKTLVELSKRPLSPPVVLVADGDDSLWLAARFRLLTVRSTAKAADLLSAVERTRREGRRPSPPS